MTRLLKTTRLAKGSFPPLLCFWCTAGILFAIGPLKSGYLSDDYDDVHAASQTSWLQPRGNHWSPFISVLFRAAHNASSGRPMLLAIAFAGHCVNAALVWSILFRRVGTTRAEAWIISTLFTLCPAGFEALAWSAAIGYVLVTTVILIGVYLSLGTDWTADGGSRWALGGLQILAFLIWDWGMLFTPILVVCIAGCPRNPGDVPSLWRKRLVLLSPSIACWAIVLATKSLLGDSLGYSAGYPVAFSPARTAYFLVSAPLRAIYPNGFTHFYRSVLGVSVSLSLLLGLCTLGAFDHRIRTAAVVFLICQIPYALLGAPESRYFYVGSPFFYTAVVLGVSRIPGRTLASVVATILVLVHTFWAVERALLWKNAYREAQSIKTAIDSRTGSPRDVKVVVNLPDRYGPQDFMWRPLVWRGGLREFKGHIIRVNTPHSPFTWRGAKIPVMNREEIGKAYCAFDILEVTSATAGDWRRFEVIDLQRAERKDSTRRSLLS